MRIVIRGEKSRRLPPQGGQQPIITNQSSYAQNETAYVATNWIGQLPAGASSYYFTYDVTAAADQGRDSRHRIRPFRTLASASVSTSDSGSFTDDPNDGNASTCSFVLTASTFSVGSYVVTGQCVASNSAGDPIGQPIDLDASAPFDVTKDLDEGDVEILILPRKAPHSKRTPFQGGQQPIITDQTTYTTANQMYVATNWPALPQGGVTFQFTYTLASKDRAKKPFAKMASVTSTTPATFVYPICEGSNGGNSSLVTFNLTGYSPGAYALSGTCIVLNAAGQPLTGYDPVTLDSPPYDITIA